MNCYMPYRSHPTQSSSLQGWSFGPYWHPENAKVAAALLIPEVTLNVVFVVDVLVLSSDGLQSGVLVPSVVNAKASIV